jgi:hypothetical protein
VRLEEQPEEDAARRGSMHSLKFGADMRLLTFNDLGYATLDGQYTFNGQYTGNSVACRPERSILTWSFSTKQAR